MANKAISLEQMSRIWGKVKTYVATAISGLYTKPSGGIPKSDMSSDVQTSLGKADTALQTFTESDPTVPSWAKQSSKPTYTAQEVGALPSSTPIPTKTSDLTNDSGFLTQHQSIKTIGGNAITGSGNIPWPTYTANDTGALPNTTTLADLPTDATHRTVTDAEKAAWDAKLSAETDPTVPSWAKEATKPTYTADEVGALPSNTIVNRGINICINQLLKTKTACGRGMILLTFDSEYILPTTTENNVTAATKTLTDLSFDPFGQVYYYSEAAIRQADEKPSRVYTQFHDGNVDLRYSFNMSNTLTLDKMVYLVCVPQSDGRAKLHSSPITQTLPTTEDGLVYKQLGYAKNSYYISLFQDKPCYYYKDGKLRLWTGG